MKKEKALEDLKFLLDEFGRNIKSDEYESLLNTCVRNVYEVVLSDKPTKRELLDELVDTLGEARKIAKQINPADSHVNEKMTEIKHSIRSTEIDVWYLMSYVKQEGGL